MAKYWYFLLLVLGMFACQDAITPECEPFQSAVKNWDDEAVNAIVDELAKDLDPEPRPDDDIGHEGNLGILMRRLKEQCDQVKVRKICYACIKTLPAQSEITFSLDSAGVEVHRILDISTPDDGPMIGIRMHGA